MNQLVFHDVTGTNFKSYPAVAFKLNLVPGVYYITGWNKVAPELGANGVGKSTLWDLILWILFDRTVRDRAPADSLVPWTDDKAPVTGAVRFERNGALKQITRKRKPNSLTLTEWDDANVRKRREITQAEVPVILGINEATFLRTVIIGQFGTFFLDLGPEQQALMFNEVLDLEWCNTAARQAGMEAEAFEKEGNKIRGEMRANYVRIEELSRQLAAETKAANLVDESRGAVLTALRADLKAAKRAVSRAVAALPAMPVAGRGAKPRHGAQEGRIQAANRAFLGAEQALAGALARSRTLEGRLGPLEDEASGYREAIKAAKKVCPACGQSVSSAHLRDKLAVILEQVDDLKAKQVDADEDATLKTAAVNGYRVELKLLAEQLAELRRKDAAAEVARAGQEREITLLRSAENKASAAVAAAEAETNPHRKTIKEVKSRKAALEDRVADLIEELQKVDAVNARATFWAKAFKEIRLSLIDQALHELEILTNHHAEALGLRGWKIEFKTERELASGNVSYKFNVQLYPPGKKEPVRWKAYCGGEVQRWQLATAFALSEILLARAGVTPNIEVLDEPTQHMSVQGVEDLLEHLSDRAADLKKVIFFVDHASFDRGLFNGTFVIERVKEGSFIGGMR